MQTHFSLTQLASADIVSADAILRQCVHCGMCLATCPTYLLLGDERDSPRGRIYLIKNLLEQGEAVAADTAIHLDRCLTCLSCETTCPSGVTYRELIDIGRAKIETLHRRPLLTQWKRWLLAQLIPNPLLFRATLKMAGWLGFLKPVIPWLRIAPQSLPKAYRKASSPSAHQVRKKVFLLMGCAQQVLRPSINRATVELLESLGVEVITSAAHCCGAVSHHLGYEEKAKKEAQELLRAFRQTKAEVIISTTSGCASLMQDYHRWFGAEVANIEILEVSQYLQKFQKSLKQISLDGVSFAYHTPCSLRHGMKIPDLPKDLLSKAGYHLVDMPEQHLCCGSAGTYHLLQSDIAHALKERKMKHLTDMRATALVSANIGCLEQMGDLPGFHYIELLNWAQNGRRPDGWKTSIR